MFLWGRGDSNRGSDCKPQNHSYHSKPLLEWQEGVSHLLEMKEGGGVCRVPEGQREGVSHSLDVEAGQGLQGSWSDRKRVSHLLDMEEGVGSAGPPHLGTCREAPGLSTGWCSHS